MPYIICVEKDSEGNLSGAQKGLAERAHHPDEINAASSLAIDAEYYLTQQVCTFVFACCRMALLHGAIVWWCCCMVLLHGAIASKDMPAVGAAAVGAVVVHAVMQDATPVCYSLQGVLVAYNSSVISHLARPYAACLSVHPQQARDSSAHLITRAMQQTVPCLLPRPESACCKADTQVQAVTTLQATSCIQGGQNDQGVICVLALQLHPL